MFSKVLVCSDGSDSALFALRAGAAIAGRFASEVLLLDVFNPMYLDAEGMGVWSLMTDQAAIMEVSELQHQAIAAQARPVFDAAGVPFTAMQELGQPVGTIIEFAERVQSDLVVIGSRGLNDLPSFVIGSVSSGVLHHAPCPVLVTHGETIYEQALRGKAEMGSTSRFRNILLASDGSPSAQRASLAARALAQKFGGALTIVNVSDRPSLLAQVAGAYGAFAPADAASRIRATLQESVVEPAQQEGIVCTLRQEEGHAAQQILCVADSIKADLIVIGSRGMGGFKSLLLGSVSTRISHHAACPVLLTR